MTFVSPFAQSDLDALMARVLERRDENWKKLQQYTLKEQEKLQITALAVFRIYGFERDYQWFPRAGFFVRSPLKADGVTISEEKRREEEDRWLRRSQNREKRTQERRARGQADNNGKDDPNSSDDGDCNISVNSNCLVEPPPGPGEVALSGGVEDIISQSFEPEFIQSANFMRFKFDQGQYALVGREKMLNRDVLRIEYYPKLLFRDDDNDNEGRRREREKPPQPLTPEQQKEKDRENKIEQDFEDDMNKTSLVTLWVDPAARQILRYEFRNIDMDFLPARWLLRINSMRATMQMAEPFPNVWLPESVAMRFRVTLALGPMEASYNVKYTDYKLAETSGRIVK